MAVPIENVRWSKTCMLGKTITNIHLQNRAVDDETCTNMQLLFEYLCILCWIKTFKPNIFNGHLWS